MLSRGDIPLRKASVRCYPTPPQEDGLIQSAFEELEFRGFSIENYPSLHWFDQPPRSFHQQWGQRHRSTGIQGR